MPVDEYFFADIQEIETILLHHNLFLILQLYLQDFHVMKMLILQLLAEGKVLFCSFLPCSESSLCMTCVQISN